MTKDRGSSICKKGDYSVVVAGNGKEALVALKGEPFDVVLMDVHMPEMVTSCCQVPNMGAKRGERIWEDEKWKNEDGY